jgi:NhaP-type Na+/H+ or K+/H+ antiporter
MKLLVGRHAFATMSFIAETFIFLYVGMDALDLDKWKMATTTVGQSFGLSSSLLVLILVGRAAFVFPLSALSNYMCKSANTKIGVRQQVPALPLVNYALSLDFHEAIVLMMSLHLHFVGCVDFQLCMVELLFTCF